ncbi:hypothetical protein [Saccharicrinis aurantiacus]|nr:hypothetical protein [Saccharicrinis aurantiacus]
MLNINNISQVKLWNAQGNELETEWLECGEGQFVASLPTGEYKIEVPSGN